MQRLFSSFARGVPGVGLLLMRCVGGAAAIVRGWKDLHDGAGPVPGALAIGAGLLVLAGLWTPIAAALIVALEFWRIAAHPAPDPLAGILLATLSAALALLGPGAWSADARLFGWKRVEVRGKGPRAPLSSLRRDS